MKFLSCFIKHIIKSCLNQHNVTTTHIKLVLGTKH